MQDPCQAPAPATIEQALHTVLDALAAVAASWPPNVRLTVRAIEAVVRLVSLHYRIADNDQADAWKTSAMAVVEEIRLTLAGKGETDDAS